MNTFNDLTHEQQLLRIDGLAQAALDLYDLPPRSYARMLNHSENTTYLVQSPHSDIRRILRVNRPGYHTKDALEDELVWLKAILRDSEIETAEPIPGKNGSYVQTAAHLGVPESRYCVMFEFLDGEAPREENLVAEFEKLGKVTALLHEHVMQWEESIFLRRPVWNYDTMLGENAKWGHWQKGLGMTSERLELFQKLCDCIRSRLESFGNEGDHFGLIHADLRLANLLLDRGHVKVIDFDDCGYSWFLYDLGAALSFIEHKAYVPDLIGAWLKGYRQVRQLSRDEENEISTFIMLRRMLLVAWIGSHSETETACEMGIGYTLDSIGLAENYLSRFGR